jgi:nucleotide-binding universal stress UspA family protein
MFGPLVVGVGGDGSGYHAAATAARIAAAMGAGLVIVFGYESSPMGPRGGPLEAQIAAVGEDAIRPIVAEFAQDFPDLLVEVELVNERPVESLITVATARDAEAIVVGHGGRGPMSGALLGSTAYEVVHRSPVPVLVVPDAQELTSGS